MFENQGEDKNQKTPGLQKKNGVIKSKEVIAEYQEALESENGSKDHYVGKLEALKERLGLGSNIGLGGEIKTNLIDNEDVVTFIDWKSNFSFFISYFLVFLIIVSGVMTYLSFLEKEEAKKADIYDENIAATKKQIVNEEILVDRGLALQKKVNALETLLDAHVYWSNFFGYLEKNTLENVVFEKFAGDLSGVYNLPSKVDSLYFSASEQIKSFRGDEMTRAIDVSKFSQNIKNKDTIVSFDIDVSVNPDIFYKKD